MMMVVEPKHVGTCRVEFTHQQMRFLI